MLHALRLLYAAQLFRLAFPRVELRRPPLGRTQAAASRTPSPLSPPTSTTEIMKRLVFTAALALGLMLPALTQGAIPQPIYFWSSVADTISAPGQPPAPEVIRPSAIGIFAD